MTNKGQIRCGATTQTHTDARSGPEKAGNGLGATWGLNRGRSGVSRAKLAAPGRAQISGPGHRSAFNSIECGNVLCLHLANRAGQSRGRIRLNRVADRGSQTRGAGCRGPGRRFGVPHASNDTLMEIFAVLNPFVRTGPNNNYRLSDCGLWGLGLERI